MLFRSIGRTLGSGPGNQGSNPWGAVFGGVAQSGEHLPCTQRVAGSIPVTSTEMSRKRFLGALCAVLISGTVNPGDLDNELSYSPATKGEYIVMEKMVFYTHPDFLRTEKIYAPYVPLYMTSLT